MKVKRSDVAIILSKGFIESSLGTGSGLIVVTDRKGVAGEGRGNMGVSHI